ncbi:hypothetical protein F5Y00DRAFT_257848 [Daldinia vernicosa]|uniref:uncharacterized protein n=1 Tax=Daldinia vernicosa TaxID=114800 RepID=UPI002007AEBB|nr:uncharacterized protein F5Y00DRAFT_257848 [Daldinia vernicosa]KAI0853190.1 hypothetical protein F5Y00DRAFT_257848 [Daldinia vernicosa]
MGFTTGFTGGVTLTLSVAYLGVLAHQRHRERQAAILRQQTRLISSIIDPLPPVLPPTRAELAAAERANLIERAKDRWNAEIEGAVQWAQNKDWEEVRENVEIALARLWARAFGDAQGPVEKGEDAAANAKAAVNAKLDQGKEKAMSVAAAAKSAYADAKAKGSEVVEQTEEKAEEAKASFLSGLASGIWKSKDVADKTKSAVAGGAKQKGEELLSPLSEEERALRQRYQGSTGLEQSPEEVLAARYASTGRQDGSQLKAL